MCIESLGDKYVAQFIFSGECNAEVGPGIATNYWFGFLRILLMSSDDETDSTDHIRAKIRDYCLRKNLTNQEIYGKIILFLQRDCNFNHDSCDMEVDC